MWECELMNETFTIMTNENLFNFRVENKKMLEGIEFSSWISINCKVFVYINFIKRSEVCDNFETCCLGYSNKKKMWRDMISNKIKKYLPRMSQNQKSRLTLKQQKKLSLFQKNFLFPIDFVLTFGPKKMICVLFVNMLRSQWCMAGDATRK